MTRKEEIKAEATEKGKDPRSRLIVVLLAAVAIISAITAGVALWIAFQEAERAEQLAKQGENAAQSKAQTAEAGTNAAQGYLRAACKAGDRQACRLRDELDRVVRRMDRLQESSEVQEGEVQEGEIQEPEIQEPESQDGDPNDPESQDAEQQDGEVQEGEQQDGEVQDAEEQEAEEQEEEIQEPEEQEPEIQDEEIQNPEQDDPDPNSALVFQAGDSCSPQAGFVVVDVGLVVSRGDGVVTYTVTCQTAPDATNNGGGTGGPE